MTNINNRKKSYPLILSMFLLFATGCNFNRNNDSQQQIEQNTNATIISTDSLEQGWQRAIDSMLLVASTAKQDTNLAKLYADIGNIYYDHLNDFEKAKAYYYKLEALSETLDWNEGYYLFAACLTDILNIEGLMDSSIVIHSQVLELAKTEMNELKIAKITVNLGNCYLYKKEKLSLVTPMVLRQWKSR